ncbi:hypothetical protein [Clostridium sp. YIM B02551]|uniref:hypothetical protein n=1 Tax=Clostridium sp. YIM B02551 TaxID=2910679 RepID=UPI001EEC98ED|nr:hypothetical protein [Clostridium sp. YIM B02551]
MGKRIDNYNKYKTQISNIFVENLKQLDLDALFNQVQESLDNRDPKHEYGVLWDNRPFLRINLEEYKDIDLYIPHAETIAILKEADKETLDNTVFFRYKDSMSGTHYYNNTFDVIYNKAKKELIYDGPRGYLKVQLDETTSIEKGCYDKEYILFILSTISDYYNV